MYDDVVIYIGEDDSCYDLFEQLPAHVPFFTECICMNRNYAIAFLSMFTPGCIIVNSMLRGEKNLATSISIANRKGALVCFYSATCSGQLCSTTCGDMNRENMLNMMHTMAEKLEERRVSDLHMEAVGAFA
jgi:hypothetical protein